MMGYGFGYGFGMLWVLVACIALVSLIVASLFRASGTYSHRQHEFRSDNSLDILNERFARGEIGEDEYNRKRQLLDRK